MINPLKIDPTRTTMLRQALVRELDRRLNAIGMAIHELVVTQDAFGIGPRPGAPVVPRQHAVTARTISIDAVTAPVANTRFAFAADAKKIEGYLAWLKERVDAGLLTVSPANKDTPWLEDYIGRAYKGGGAAAYDKAKGGRGGRSMDFIEGGKDAFLKTSFAGPIAQGKLASLSTRAFTELKGITPVMDQQMTRVLADGLARGVGPRELGAQLGRVIGIAKSRAATIARTEIVRAHNEGQLDSFDAMNIEGVGVKAEWSTAHDNKVCPQCAPLEGVILTIREARGMLPRHPNCRCAWIPAGVGEEDTGIKWSGPKQGLAPPGTKPTGKTTYQVTGKAVARRVEASIKAELPGIPIDAARDKTQWAGGGLRISGKPKPGDRALVLKAENGRKALALAFAKAKTAAAKKAAAATSAKSAIVRTDIAKVGLGVPDGHPYFAIGADNLPVLTEQGMLKYAKDHNVTLTPENVRSILDIGPGKDAPKMVRQLRELERIVSAKSKL